mgnify:FL=1
MAEKSNSMGADATLVSAAQKMGQALVPADTSKMFKEQFEALGKMHEAKASMITGAITTGLGVLQAGIDNKKAKKAKFQKRAASSIEGGDYGNKKRREGIATKIDGEIVEPVTRTSEEIEGNQGNEINVGTTGGYKY